MISQDLASDISKDLLDIYQDIFKSEVSIIADSKVPQLVNMFMNKEAKKSEEYRAWLALM